MFKSYSEIIRTIPYSKTKIRKKQPKKILKLLKEKHRLYKKSKTDRSFKVAYREQSKKYKSALRECRKRNEENVLKSQDKKVLYNYMKNRLNTRHRMPPLRQPNGEITLDSQTKANLLNQTFAKVYLKNDNNKKINLDMHMNNTKTTPHIISPITFQDILQSIVDMKSSVSQTPDQIPSLYIKKTATNLLKPLCIIFNRSIQTSEIPSMWRKAIIIPIYKKGKAYDPTNYRPISLTSVICRMLERIVHKTIVSHLKTNKLISAAQHGFVSKKSTQTQQLIFLNKLTQLYDEKKQTDIVYLDFSKAFDTVSHGKLLKVLDHLKINNKIVTWIGNYLSHRTQTTLVEDARSDEVAITSGVPQGSVVGPLLFIVYIDVLIRMIEIKCPNVDVYAYADDIKIQSNNCQELQLALDVVNKWVDIWQLRLNTAKSEHITIKESAHHTLIANQETIPKVNTVRDLGITISNDFSWMPYINRIRAKAIILSNSILKTFLVSNCWLLLDLYKTYVRPIVEYNTCSWSPHLDGEIKRIEGVQRKFTKRLCQKCNISFSDYKERLLKLNLESLKTRREKRDLTFLYKIFNNYVDINFTDLFEEIPPPTYSLRRHKYYIPRQQKSNSDTRLKFFSNRVINNWNDLPENIVCSETLDIFKLKIKKHKL